MDVPQMVDHALSYIDECIKKDQIFREVFRISSPDVTMENYNASLPLTNVRSLLDKYGIFYQIVPYKDGDILCDDNIQIWIHTQSVDCASDYKGVYPVCWRSWAKEDIQRFVEMVESEDIIFYTV